jgi:hypothetical protein
VWRLSGGGRRSHGAGIQTRSDFRNGPAALRVKVQAMACGVEKNRGQRIGHERILPRIAGGSGEMLRECFHEGDSEGPDVTGRRDDSLGDFRRIVWARMMKAGGWDGLLRLGRGEMRLLGVVGYRGKTIARELELIVNRQDVGGADVSVH